VEKLTRDTYAFGIREIVYSERGEGPRGKTKWEENHE
jgi:hypothetical protein